MGESEASHPYRPDPPPGVAVASRRVPWIVSVNVLIGGWMPGVMLFLSIPMSAVFWIPPTDRPNVEQVLGRVFLLALVMLPASSLFLHVRKRWAELRLLRTGVVAYAKLHRAIIHDRSGDSVEGQSSPPDNLHFKFEHRGLSYDVVQDVSDAEPLMDDPREQIVFRPGQESHAVLVDSLPGRPRIREDNTIAWRNHVTGSVVALFLLAVAIAVNVTGVFVWFRFAGWLSR
jgi:hypothetical protein